MPKKHFSKVFYSIALKPSWRATVCPVGSKYIQEIFDIYSCVCVCVPMGVRRFKTKGLFDLGTALNLSIVYIIIK